MPDQDISLADEGRYPSILGGVLSYLVPGLGQIAQGRIAKGVLFMVVLLGMFHAGQAMGDWKNVYLPAVEQRVQRLGEFGPEFRTERTFNPLTGIYNRWHYAGQFWIGIAAWPALAQFYDIPLPGSKESTFLRNLQREPQTRERDRRRPDFDAAAPNAEDQLNQFLQERDKLPDLGWAYTVIAGVLNLLVIYDAFAGPALGRTARTPPSEPAQEPART